MTKKPTLTERVTHLEEALAASAEHAKAVERRASYTELNSIQLVEDARKARHDARAASIISFAALVLVLALALMEALR